jgi:trimeric autotransporter adhesin
MRGSGLVLQNNGSDNLAIASDGSFKFGTSLPTGTPYNVTVATQPSDPVQICSVTNSAGTVNGADVTNVAVSCVDVPPL